jgi:hypothetical protein
MLVCVVGCGGAPEGAEKSEPSARPPLDQVLAEEAPALMAIPGVVLVADGTRKDGSQYILVGIVRDAREIRERIPSSLRGYAVEIEVTGTIEPLGQ